jgi:hypothetical protein
MGETVVPGLLRIRICEVHARLKRIMRTTHHQGQLVDAHTIRIHDQSHKGIKQERLEGQWARGLLVQDASPFCMTARRWPACRDNHCDINRT